MLYRCKRCGSLLTDSMIQKGQCAGHQIEYAIRGTFWEWLKVKLRIIR